MDLNTNWEERDRYLFGEDADLTQYGYGGTRRVRQITFEQLNWLITNNFADPEEYQNDAPTIGSLCKFLQEHPTCTVSGYVVSPERTDSRVSIDKIQGSNMTSTDLQAFIDRFRYATEFEVDLENKTAFAWWD